MDYKYPVDAFILPVSLIPDEDFPYSFIAYGRGELLNVAIIKGCSDYMKEPWNFDELLFRTERLISTIGYYRVDSAPISQIAKYQSERPGTNGNLLYIEGDRLCCCEYCVNLSFYELKIMRLLLNNRGRLVSRDALFYTLWGEIPDYKSRVVDVYVSMLRKKLHRLGNNVKSISSYSPLRIRSIRGKGYILVEN